ncbi:hypothetical protein PQX77_006868 [Marasmius sp. AFHP31]|nr:hypothetical protein PQX77_006868 [Marasmius sp. AFHP31]
MTPTSIVELETQSPTPTVNYPANEPSVVKRNQAMKLPEYEKHPKYSFEDANVAFIVEDRLKFDIHRHFLQRDSKHFSALLAAQSSHPDGTYRIPGLKIHEFESLLDFFYEGMYQPSPVNTPIESWVNLLSISTTMEFPRAREYAILAIDVHQYHFHSIEPLSPARMIQIANTYGVEKWLEPAYEALAERDEVIDENEAEMIGMKGVLAIMKARETRLRDEIRRAQVSEFRVNGDHTPGENTGDISELEDPLVSESEEEKEPSLSAVLASEVPENASLLSTTPRDVSIQEPLDQEYQQAHITSNANLSASDEEQEGRKEDDQAGSLLVAQPQNSLPPRDASTVVYYASSEPNWHEMNKKRSRDIELCQTLIDEIQHWNRKAGPRRLTKIAKRRRLAEIEAQGAGTWKQEDENESHPLWFDQPDTHHLRRKRQGKPVFRCTLCDLLHAMPSRINHTH